jgi:putative lipoic acid-binding regulatory protein
LHLLQFPTDYPIKVIGRATDGLRARVDAIMAAHVPDLNHALTTERPSASGHFLAISYAVVAVSATQIEALVIDLKAAPDVLVIL